MTRSVTLPDGRRCECEPSTAGAGPPAAPGTLVSLRCRIEDAVYVVSLDRGWEDWPDARLADAIARELGLRS